MQSVFVYAVAAILLLVTPFTASAQGQSRSELVTGDTVPALGGWNVYCRDYVYMCAVERTGKAVVALTEESRRVIEDVNNEVNARIHYLPDIDHWGSDIRRYVYSNGDTDKWDHAEDGYGDCEDFALLKQKLLIEKGFPRSAVLLTRVEGEQPDATGIGHLILMVRTDQGDFLLDDATMKRPLFRWWESSYRFLSRQSEEHPNVWVALHKPALISEQNN